MSQLKRSKHLKIPLKEIKRATQNFQVCIGQGGYGMVYKGELVISGKPTIAAIKRLNEQSYGQGLKEFLTEVQLLCGQKHPNLIHLLGYCDEKKEKIIVYEYAERGSLDRYLRGGNNTLTWLQRLKICIDAARGLEYLHYRVGDHQTIIHRDIKSANILLDDNWVAKLSDLGLAKLSLAGLNRSEVVSNPCGTRGYCDPQYRESSIVTKESDIYSFGIVLFEVLSGKLCTNLKGNDGFRLSPDSAKDYYLSKSLDEIVDPRLKEEINLDSMNRFAEIAKRCLHDDRGERPSMNLVVKQLEELLEVEEPPELEPEEPPELEDSGVHQESWEVPPSSLIFRSAIPPSNLIIRGAIYQPFGSEGVYLLSDSAQVNPKDVAHHPVKRLQHKPCSIMKNELRHHSRLTANHREAAPLFEAELPKLKEEVRKLREPTLSRWQRFKAWRVFKHFDLDNDDALNPVELHCFLDDTRLYILLGDHHYYIPISDFLDLYEEHIDDEKGLTFSGLLLCLTHERVSYSLDDAFGKSRMGKFLDAMRWTGALVVILLLLIIHEGGFHKMKEGLEVLGGSAWFHNMNKWLKVQRSSASLVRKCVEFLSTLRTIIHFVWCISFVVSLMSVGGILLDLIRQWA